MSTAVMSANMSTSLKTGTATKPGFEHIITPKIHRIRITLSSRNVKAIETGIVRFLFFSLLTYHQCRKNQASWN